MDTKTVKVDDYRIPETGRPSPEPDPNHGRGMPGWNPEIVENAAKLREREQSRAEEQVDRLHTSGTILGNW